MSIEIPTGTFDILPQDPKEEWRSMHLWHYVEGVIRQHAKLYGLEEIRTPMFERTELFVRGVGESSDIVMKEMYTFEDKGGRSLTLRPEGTASVVRAFMEKNLHMQAPCHRFYYVGPMFRYERPQAGRFRQHHQFGIEIIGLPQPQADAEMIELCYSLFQKLGLQNLNVYINSLGDKETRENFRNDLKAYLQGHYDELSEDSKKRLSTNPLRILDSKDENDRKVLEKAPTIIDHLSGEALDHFNRVKSSLDIMNIPYAVNPFLVRGLDYYTKTVFEVTSGQLGAQNSVVGGGRYDGLMKELGGPDLPCIGFGSGIERLIQTMLRQGVPFPARVGPHAYVIPLGEKALQYGFELVRNLRKAGVSCIFDTSGKKLKNAMGQASDLKALHAIVLGDNELEKGVVEVKEMATGVQEKVSLAEIELYFQTKYLRT